MKRFLIGKHISLHGLCEADIRPDRPYYTWLDDLSLDTFTERSRFPNSERRMRDYYERACKGDDLVLLGIFDNASGQHIGNFSFQEIDWIRGRANFGYMIGDKECQGRGLATEAVLMALYYGFTKLNFERLYTLISEQHKASLRVAEKTGLKVEGRMRAHFVANGKPADAIIVGALRDEWMEECEASALALYEQPPQ